jgi:sulfur-oxidizing protein SoxA
VRTLHGIAYAGLATLFVSGVPAASQTGSNTRVIPEAAGIVRTEPDGRRVQMRYPKWDDTDFSAFPTHGYGDTRTGLPVKAADPPPTGDPRAGEEVWKRSACINCHILPQDARWAGNVGPSFAEYGTIAKDVRRTFQMIFDGRALFPNSFMPPWGAAGLLTAQEIADLAAFLHGVKSPQDRAELRENPDIRPLPQPYFGASDDPGNNPAVVLAEKAETQWAAAGPSGKGCSQCHGEDIDQAMSGVATRYPAFSPRQGRVLSLEDFLSVHGPEVAGTEMPVGGDANLNMTMRIKLSSRNQPIALDLQNADMQAALARGKQTFYRRVGQRNHACADCHTEATVGGRWLGGRYLGRATAEVGLTRTYPAWRTSFEEAWSLRKRIQWCMLPHNTNNLPADSVEYAELELYLASFENGKILEAPGLKD